MNPMHEVIATTEALAGLLARLEPASRVAVDTEADSLHCYFEKLCLVQISVPGLDVLVDPLAGVSLEPLLSLLAARQVILHGADFDLRMLRRAGPFEVNDVFDTMIAARLTGRLEFSLAALIAENFGIVLTKGSQKANWARRPLSPQMEEYAMNDTRYLIPLADKLEADLRALGRWEWFRQSCERAVENSRTTRARDPEMAWRISGSNELAGRSLAILRALWNWREAEAQEVDRPPFHILRNEDLVESSRRIDAGERVEFKHLFGARRSRFFAAASAARELPAEEWPRFPKRIRTRPSPEADRRFQNLKTIRDAAATELKLDPSLIAPKATLDALAEESAEALERLLPWQREILYKNP